MSMDGKRQVQVGDTVIAPLPPTEVLYKMRVAYEVRTLRIGENTVEIIGDDGTPKPYTPTHAEAGVQRDAEGGLWVEPVPDTLVQAFHYGKPVSVRMTSDFGIARWFKDHCAAYSMDHAIRYEGYSVREVSTKAERAELASLVDQVRETTAAWEKLPDEDTTGDAAVVAVGERLARLLETLAGQVFLSEQVRTELAETARGLRTACEFTAEATERDSDVMTNILDRLDPGLALAERAAQA
jgi:hypothetical protein